MSFPINVNIPQANSDPADDQPLIQQNFANISSFLGVDHVPAGSLNNGYHTVVHFQQQSGNPAPVGTFGELYAKLSTTINTDEVLWWQSGGGRATQLTMNFVPSATTNGYTYLPGGIILQWGDLPSSATASQTVTFIASGNINFPNNIFVAIAMPRRAFSSGLTTNVTVSNESTTGFVINNNNSASTSLAYDWIAIGN